MQSSTSTADTPMGGDILIVDDNPNNLGVLSGILEEAGYTVRPAISGEQALKAAQLAAPDLALLDIRMPQMDGYEVARRLRDNPKTADLPIIFISALQEAEDKIAAFKAGGVDYIIKPFQMEEVLARVETHLALNRAYAEMEGRVEARTRELSSAQEQLLQTLEQTIDAMGMTMEKRDPYTAGHQHRVSDLAVAIGQELGMEKEQLTAIRLGALIHDIGKISVPTELLTRPGRLSEMEMQIIRTHSRAGFDIVKDIDFPWPIAQIVHQHHERIDGTGYPEGLKGEAIIPEARVVAVADVIEAMVSHRPYRPGLPLEAGLNELREHRGSRYDNETVDAALGLFSRDEPYVFPPP
ncbi:MAG: HD domain-containing phosphohydrolase [Pseudomonadota bacterium]